jgi:N-acetylglucosaminyldiphosphoundecaprenol N-acetyl-beta-D-mannosaminyltransferase
MTSPPTLSILRIPVHDVTTEETLALIDQFVRERTPHQICTVNPEFIMAAQHDAEFKRILNRSALNLPDGIGVCGRRSDWAIRCGNGWRDQISLA